ncbi:hypothetical protein [Lutibacter maritimus]|uniref:DUF4145 domain-containing protein n=1 Tax=Lutibacter maritimus TaxID=593133 RepID=A0A1I6SQN5_9FLAO|nr:hypothetical protein [Lutibacter maritimus]SFS79262.1 hypothetical protein SAMN04488006_0058 [Lutibacter maritimus]
MKWYEPEHIWDIYGINNRVEFVEKYVVEGKFHKDVPDDILKSFETVSYLLAHSYYHWPMFDEALKKILGIYEMAIKLKCQLLGIKIEYKAKDGKVKKQNLGVLIDQLVKLEGYPKDLKFQLKGTTELRNMLAHPNSYSFMGALNIRAIIRTVNIINQLFLKSNWYEEQQVELLKIQSKCQKLQDKLFIFDYKNERILVHEIEIVAVFKEKGKFIYCMSFQKLTNDVSNLNFNNIPAPIILFLNEIKFTDSCLFAFNVETKLKIDLTETVNPLNITKHENHKIGFSNLEDKDKNIYFNIHSTDTDDLIQKYIYKNSWK